MKRGEVWWADLEDPEDSEPGGRRPLLIVQSDQFNASSINTTLCVVMTTNLRLADAPGNVFLSRQATGLPKDSVANVSQIVTIDKSWLRDFVSEIPRKYMQEVDVGLLCVLDLLSRLGVSR